MRALDGVRLDLWIVRLQKPGIRGFGESVKAAGIGLVIFANRIDKPVVESTGQIDHRPNILGIHNAKKFVRLGKVSSLRPQIDAFLRLRRYRNVSMNINDWEFRSVNVRLLRVKHVENISSLPFVDVLYIRCDWRNVQTRPGRLDLDPVWKLTLDAAKRRGLRVAFRVQLSNTSFQPEQIALPEFLRSRVPTAKIGRIPEHGNAEWVEPRYDHPEFQKAFAELNNLLAAEFDGNPLIEWMDVMVEETYELIGDGFRCVVTSPFGPHRFVRCYQQNRLVQEEIADDQPEDVIFGFYGEAVELVEAFRQGRRPQPTIEDIFPSVQACFELVQRVESNPATVVA